MLWDIFYCRVLVGISYGGINFWGGRNYAILINLKGYLCLGLGSLQNKLCIHVLNPLICVNIPQLIIQCMFVYLFIYLF